MPAKNVKRVEMKVSFPRFFEKAGTVQTSKSELRAVEGRWRLLNLLS